MRFRSAGSRPVNSAAIAGLIVLLFATWCLYPRLEPVSIEQLVEWENLGYLLSFALGLMHLTILLIGLIGASDAHTGAGHDKAFGKEVIDKTFHKDFQKALVKEGFDKTLVKESLEKAFVKEGAEKEGFAKAFERILDKILGRPSPEKGVAVEKSHVSKTAQRDVSRPPPSLASLTGLGRMPLSFYLPVFFFVFPSIGISLNAFSRSLEATNVFYGAANYLLAMLCTLLVMGAIARSLMRRLGSAPTMAVVDRLATAKWDFVENRGFIHIRVGGAVLERKARNVDPDREIRRGDTVWLVEYEPELEMFSVERPGATSEEHPDRR